VKSSLTFSQPEMTHAEAVFLSLVKSNRGVKWPGKPMKWKGWLAN